MEITPMELVELLVEADVSRRQIKVADVVAASVVVVFGVGIYDVYENLRNISNMSVDI